MTESLIAPCAPFGGINTSLIFRRWA